VNGWFDIKLTRASVEYTVSVINNRDSRLNSKKISLRSSFPFIRGYAASVRMALCYIRSNNMIQRILLLVVLVFSSSVYAGEQQVYDIVMVEKSGGDWRAVKYNISSGESWYIRNGVFIRLLDDEVLPESRYKVVATKHKGGWGAVKMDIISGNAWKLNGEMFVRVKDTK